MILFAPRKTSDIFMPDNIDLEKLFNNPDLLALALTHKSWINEHEGTKRSNERLEFLGDAVLEFVVSKELYLLFPDKEEGFLTTLRSNIVNTSHLSEAAGRLDLGKLLFLSKGEEEGGGRNNPSLLANTIEAVIGALYIDGGTASAENFIKNYILSDLSELKDKPLKDAKSRFQEMVQAKGLMAPNYYVVDEEGPDHAKQFTVEVRVEKVPYARGSGKNKSEAQQSAARKAISVFNKNVVNRE